MGRLPAGSGAAAHRGRRRHGGHAAVRADRLFRAARVHSPTRRGDHRSLVLAFFVVLPAQFWLAATRRFDLFTVFIPVYVFLALPQASALAGTRSGSWSARQAASQPQLQLAPLGTEHGGVQPAVPPAVLHHAVWPGAGRGNGVPRLRGRVAGFPPGASAPRSPAATACSTGVNALCFSAPVFFHPARRYFGGCVSPRSRAGCRPTSRPGCLEPIRRPCAIPSCS